MWSGYTLKRRITSFTSDWRHDHQARWSRYTTRFTTMSLVGLYGILSYYGCRVALQLDEYCYLVVGIEHILLIDGVWLELEFGWFEYPWCRRLSDLIQLEPWSIVSKYGWQNKISWTSRVLFVIRYDFVCHAPNLVIRNSEGISQANPI